MSPPNLHLNPHRFDGPPDENCCDLVDNDRDWTPYTDVNDNGWVGTWDLRQFVNQWLYQKPAADYNGDGLIDTRDLRQFVRRWVRTTGACS